MAPNIYSILDLPKSATRAQVNKAYRKAAKALHPDRGGSNEAIAALNAAKEAYDNAGVADSDAANNVGSDGDYVEGSDDDDECAFAYDYGDLEETGGSYMVLVGDGLEITLEEHEEICSCDLDAEDAAHFLASGQDDKGDNCDADSAVGDMEETDEDIESEDFGDNEVDDIDEGFEDGDEED